jgi:hypothetical protein
MEWFVQTPQYSFKNTLGHSTVLVVFSPGGYHPEYRAGLQDPFSSGVVRLRRMTFQTMTAKPAIDSEHQRTAQKPFRHFIKTTECWIKQAQME